MAYTELNITTENCDPNDEFTLTYRPLSGTFKSDWNMQCMVRNVPKLEYLPLNPDQPLVVHKGNGFSQIFWAFSNYQGTQNYNTTDNYFEFTVKNKSGMGRTVIISTNTADLKE